MENFTFTRTGILALLGGAGGVVASLLGGWDGAMRTLIIFMAIDYITGLAVGGIFQKSPKTENGALESKAGWKGLFRKGITLLIVCVGVRLDLMTNSSFIRDSAVTAFTINELMSITENAKLMGIPMPGVIEQALEVFHKQERDAS